MNVNLKKSCWVMLLIFCCIFLSESVASKSMATDKIPKYAAEEEQKDTIFKENDRRYLNLYISEKNCIKIDLILILEFVVLLFVIILERMR